MGKNLDIKKLALNGIVAVILFLLIFIVTFLSLVIVTEFVTEFIGSTAAINFSIVPLLISIIASGWLLWKFLRRSMAVDESKQTLETLAKFWLAGAFLLVTFYMVGPLVSDTLKEMATPLCDGTESYIPEDPYGHAGSLFCSLQPSQLSILTMITVLQIVYLYAVKEVGSRYLE